LTKDGGGAGVTDGAAGGAEGAAGGAEGAAGGADRAAGGADRAAGGGADRAAGGVADGAGGGDQAVLATVERGRWRRLRRHAIDVRPLRHPAFRRLFVGNAISFFGYQFTAVAVPVQMFAITESSGWVGLLGLAALVPLLIFALWGGAVADAVDRRRLLLASSLVMWAATLALLVQAVLGVRSPTLLLALVAVQSVGFAVSTPTRSAIVPRLVEPVEVPAANTLSFTISNLASVAGPLGAGLVITHGPFAFAYGVDALLFTVALWAALRLPALPPLDGRNRSGARLDDVMFGLRYLATTPVVLLSFAIDIAAMVLAMPRALFPEVAQERFGGAGAIGWLYSSIAIGSVAAGVTSGWIGRVRRQGLALVVAVVAWGVAVAGAGFAGSLWLAVLLLAVGGAADLVSAVYRQTILQTYAPDELRGRMQGVFTAVVAGGPRLGDLRAGEMALLTGSTVAWVGGGVAAAVVAVALALAFPALRRYTSG
jgi:MFS family permease